MGRRTGLARRHPLVRRLLLPGSFIAAWVLGGLALPLAASAHPLGNFTINHYAGLTIGVEGIDLDVVIDMAEIPAFQERQAADTDGDGTVSDEEAAAYAAATCPTLATSLHLERDGSALALTGTGHAVSFPPGAGGLSTLRLECGFHATFAAPIGGTVKVTFIDTSYAERIGWREITATGAGTILHTGALPETSPSHRLTAYPADMIAQPLDIRSASIEALPAPVATTPAPVAAAPAGPTTDSPAAVPGGVAGELPAVIVSALSGDLNPVVLLVALAAAIAVGALHAVTPGHGKTLMAAYLVGSRGSRIHAVGLGLSVAVSHTLGIFVLALLIVAAQGLVAPDVVQRTTPVIAAMSIVAIGGWMLVGETRRRLALRRASARTGFAAWDAIPHGRDHDHEGPAEQHDHDHEHDHAGAGMHSHGGVRHSHLPPAGSTLSWRGLFVLGLAGGLIPSTSALLILLSSIAAGRPAFGLVLVVAFGLGMAAVMTGVGLVMVVARGRLDRMPSRSGLGRLAALAPLLASVVVLGLGLALTWSAVTGRPVL
jgi:nickel/cobalt transporter (NicO) family protein